MTRKHLLAGFLALSLSTILPGGDIREVIRTKGETLEPAIVRVRCVVKAKWSARGGASRERESKRETIGCFVSADGLVLVQLDKIDPAAGWRRRAGEKAAAESNYDTTLKSVKVVLQDRTELDAAVVLRDSDRDFAFLRLSEAPKEPCKFIDLEEAAAQPAIMDEVGALGRWDRLGSRVTPWACTGRITAVLEKPRRMYGLGGDLAALHSAIPLYEQDGKLVGIAGTYLMEGSADSQSGDGATSMPVIVPAADLVAGLKAAKTAKPEVPPTETPAAPAAKAEAGS